MEELLLLAILIEEEESIQKRSNLRILRDNSNPFNIPDNLFIKRYRLPKSLCLSLIKELEPFDMQRTKLPFFQRFLCTLYFCANGSYQGCVGVNSGISLSQSSVSRSLAAISELIIERKKSQVRFPKTEIEQSKIKIGFQKAFGIKGTIGAVGCTHINIIAPSKCDAQYKNWMGNYSINVEAICDHCLCFTSVNAKFPGSYHDSAIWDTTPARKYLMENRLNDTWLLGNSGYPLEPWLMVPIIKPSNDKENQYNQLQQRARGCIDRAFAVLRRRFKCLANAKGLYYRHEKATAIIYTCMILHNMLIKAHIPIDENETKCDNEEGFLLVYDEHMENELLEDGERTRSRFVSSLSSS